ncbi:GNAT family N-acetyltransferase [Marinomonas sp. 5E14-1]|uniref:GNAT family N-acetyltransferase n=1 Tax=Marinomonas sp. 5E14-1 TaxID=3153922 RepID=UPI0032645CDB
MSVFSSPKKLPYFAITLSSRLILDDLIHRIMIDKMIALATEQPGCLGAEFGGGEIGFVVTYWQTKESAEAWLQHNMHRRVLSLGESFWYEEYSLKLCEVLSDMPFKATDQNLYNTRFPRIDTQHGVLKILDESQVDLFHQYIIDERAFHEPWEPARSESYYSLETCLLRVREMRRDFLEDKGVALCLLSPNEDRMLAYTNYSNIVRGVFQGCNLGYSLRQDEQGKGIMHETLKAGIDYLQKELNIERIQASYMPRNNKSAAVLKKMGFEKEGVARDYLKINDVWEDHILTALILR